MSEIKNIVLKKGIENSMFVVPLTPIGSVPNSGSVFNILCEIDEYDIIDDYKISLKSTIGGFENIELYVEELEDMIYDGSATFLTKTNLIKPDKIISYIESYLIRKNISHLKKRITNIEVTDHTTSLDVIITTHDAGLLIGKDGEFVNGLQQHINLYMQSDNREYIRINIHIEDDTLWD